MDTKDLACTLNMRISISLLLLNTLVLYVYKHAHKKGSQNLNYDMRQTDRMIHCGLLVGCSEQY